MHDHYAREYTALHGHCSHEDGRQPELCTEMDEI